MKDIAKQADTVITALKKKNNDKIYLKTNQIRKFLTAVNLLTNKVSVYQATHLKETTLSDDLASEIKFLKVKAVYQASRDRAVKEFIKEAEIMNQIDGIGNSIKKYQEFAQYMEALVAYHKFYGGKD